MKKLLWAILATAIIAGANPETCYAKKKSKKNDKKEQVKDTTAKESKYEKLIKGAKTQKGMFTLHITNDNKLLVEVPDSLMNRTFLLSSRVAATTDPKIFVAGEMTTNPFMIRFSKNEQSLFMHLVHRRERSHSGIFRQKFWRPYYQSIQNLYPKRERRGSRHE